MVAVFAIAGPSGAGKTTLVRRLAEAYPQKIAVLRLDDFYFPREALPRQNGTEDWDHPHAINFMRFAHAIKHLKQRNALTIETWDPLLNPGYAESKKKIPITIEPKPILIAEGFLVLYSTRVRREIGTSLYLDIDPARALERRAGKVMIGDEYLRTIALPHQLEYVLPTKRFADHRIDADALDEEAVYRKAVKIIRP